MLPDKDIQLDSVLVDEVAAQMVAERRKAVATKIREILTRNEGLAKAILIDEKTLEKNREKLKKNQEIIDELRKGNWAVLAEPKPEEVKEETK